MIKRILNQIFSRETPKRLRLLNISILLPILIWPLIFYTTIFFFDNPKHLGKTFLLFFAVNGYPIYLLIIAYFNSRLLQKNSILGSILPSYILIVIFSGLAYFVIETSQNVAKSIRISTERKKKGYIGPNDVYRVRDEKVYRYDTLIVGADAKTFELVSWDWQRDANHYYRFGERIDYIDGESFELLDYHYAKDRNNVYYDEKIIQGADPKTFRHTSGTQDGRDAFNCYRYGKKVDCEVLESTY